LSNDEYFDPEYMLKSKEEITKDKIYITKYDDTWSRVKVIDIINDSEVSSNYNKNLF